MIDDAVIEGNFSKHRLTILRDDGLYRHWRCQAPGTYVYGFDVITWPGHLCVAGDIGAWVFSRIEDMVEFFEGDNGRVNLSYWSEKLVDGHDRARQMKTLEEPQWNGEYGVEMPPGTQVDDGWNVQFVYACHGIVLAIKLYREVKVPA